MFASQIDIIGEGSTGWRMKLLSVLAVLLLVTLSASFAQEIPGLVTPTRADLESTIGGMGLPMTKKLALRDILQDMEQKAAKVKADASLSDEQKVAKITGIRSDAFDQTDKVLTGPQQKQLSALFQPKS